MHAHTHTDTHTQPREQVQCLRILLFHNIEQKPWYKYKHYHSRNFHYYCIVYFSQNRLYTILCRVAKKISHSWTKHIIYYKRSKVRLGLYILKLLGLSPPEEKPFQHFYIYWSKLLQHDNVSLWMPIQIIKKQCHF